MAKYKVGDRVYFTPSRDTVERFHNVVGKVVKIEKKYGYVLEVVDPFDGKLFYSTIPFTDMHIIALYNPSKLEKAML